LVKQIPIAIEQAILAKRQNFREMNDKARKETDGKFGFVTRPDKLGKFVRFWNVEDDNELEDFLFEDLLAAAFDSPDLDLMPKGYGIILTVLEFEQHCQFEGWYTISNRSDSMPKIISCYQQIGLEEEAMALLAVWKVYSDVSSDDVENFNELLSKAYRDIPNSTPDIEDRIPHILNFVRKNAALFYEQGTL